MLMKKTPMYSSNINTEYEFADYTAPSTSSNPMPNLAKLARLKHSAVLNSQLIGIQQSRQEDNGDLKKLPLLDTFNCQQSFLDPTNTDCLFGESKLEYCRGVKPASTINFADLKMSQSNKSGCFYQREERENIKTVNFCEGTPSMGRRGGDYSSPEIIKMMVSPFKDNMQFLMSRVKNKNKKML